MRKRQGSRLGHARRAIGFALVAVILASCLGPSEPPMEFSPGTWLSSGGEYQLTLEADGTAPVVRLDMYPTDGVLSCLEAWPPLVDTTGTWWQRTGLPELDLVTALAPGSHHQVHLGRGGDWRVLRYYPCGPDFEAIVLERVADTT